MDSIDASIIEANSIQYRSICKYFGKYCSKGSGLRTVLRDISFQVPSAKVLAIVGPSGCGKTTLLKLLNKLEVPDSGNIFIGDTSIETIPDAVLRSRIGYVVQSAGLFPHMTVRENIVLVPRLCGWSKVRISTRLAELFDLVRLDASQVADVYPATLSGGQQQRIGIARALVMDPSILIMDEPFGALDPNLRRDLQVQFKDLQSRLAKTVMIVTHDMEEAIALSDYIAVMSSQGTLLQMDRTETVVRSPASREVAQMFVSL